MTLGSLFDGSGGFPLAGALNGFTPVWASEIEPYPLLVTSLRFPKMEQLGNIMDVDGALAEPVDVITFGSPCQDLSIAGKQTGIHDGKRSSLFFEAVRIIREMRGITNGKYPRFAVWENVPGAFSSNKGADFRAVLQALCEIAEPCVSVPEPPKGKWAKAGCIVGDGYSIAWRVYDAQYWGVPQRRKRIYLVADFGSERAGEILFEREGVRGDSAQGREAREGAADDAAGGTGGSDREGESNCITPWDVQSRRIYTSDGSWPSLYGGEGGGHGYVIADAGENASGRCYAFHLQQDPIGGSVSPCIGGQHQATVGVFMGGQSARAGSIAYDETVAPTLRASESGSNQVPDIVYPEKARALTARHDSSPCADRGQNVVALDCRNMVANEEISGTLQAKSEGRFSLNFINPVVYDSRGNGDGSVVPNLTGDHENRVTDYTAICVGNGQLHQTELGDKTGAINCMHDQQAVVHSANPPRRYIVRRLTPLECCRLQGFPDWWEDGANGSDSARYKMWGNGIALPCAADVMRRIAKEMNHDGTKPD